MKLAHLSDLHIGKSPARAAACSKLREALERHGIDYAIVTGDITDHGREEEYAEFIRIFGDWIAARKLAALPGNHDRHNGGVAERMMRERVETVALPGIRLVTLDSTGPHNRRPLAGHGMLDEEAIEAVLGEVGKAVNSEYVIVALHHHLFPLPEDLWIEWFSNFLRLPYAKELRLGKKLLQELEGRCDLVLHGHRHAPVEWTVGSGGRRMRLYNAGSTTSLRRFRVFEIENGSLKKPPSWIRAH